MGSLNALPEAERSPSRPDDPYTGIELREMARARHIYNHGRDWSFGVFESKVSYR